MSETKQLPPIIDATGRAWALCLRHDEGQDITGRRVYGEREATTDDIAAVLAALPDDARNDIIGPFLLDERMSEGHWMAHWVDTAKLAHEGQQALTKEAESRAAKLESELSAEREGRRVELASWVQWADAVEAMAVPASKSWLLRPDKREASPPSPPPAEDEKP